MVPPPGSASLFTPAYRVSHADAGGQSLPGSGEATGYDTGAPGTGYPWADGEQGQAGYGQGGYGSAAYGSAGYGAADGPAWPDDEFGSPYSWGTDDQDAWPGTDLPDAGAQRL